MFDRNPPKQVDPGDTVTTRVLKKTAEDRTTRETIGNTTGVVGGSAVVLWLARLAGIDIPPEAAVVIGSTLTAVISSLFRKYLLTDHSR